LFAFTANVGPGEPVKPTVSMPVSPAFDTVLPKIVPVAVPPTVWTAIPSLVAVPWTVLLRMSPEAAS
jgi:hypothetical protein